MKGEKAMKKTLFIVFAFVLFLLSLFGCAQDTNSSLESGELTVTFFESSEELAQHFASHPQFADSTSQTPSVFSLKDSIAGLELDEIKLTGAFVYYKYMPMGHVEDVQKKSINRGSATFSEKVGASSAPDERLNQLAEDDTYLPDDSHYLFDKVSVGWNYNGHGDECLEDFVNRNNDRVKELPDCPGFYFSDCVTPRGTLYGKMLYWVQEDCFFQAAIPIDIYEEALAELTAPTPVMQRIQIGDVTE